MTIRLELTPEEWAALSRCAEASGSEVADVLHALIAPLVTHAISDVSAAVEDTNLEEDRAEQEREQTEMQNNIRRWRAEKRHEQKNT